MASRFESHPGERCVSLTSHQYFSQGLYPIPTSKSDNKGQANSRSVAAYNTFLGPLSRWNKAEAEETFSIRPATNVSRRASHQRAHAWSLSLFLSLVLPSHRFLSVLMGCLQRPVGRLRASRPHAAAETSGVEPSRESSSSCESESLFPLGGGVVCVSLFHGYLGDKSATG